MLRLATLVVLLGTISCSARSGRAPTDARDPDPDATIVNDAEADAQADGGASTCGTSELATPFPGPPQCPLAPVAGGVYLYVDATAGLDSNDGTTSALALKTVGKALGLARPGDVVQLASGTYRERVDYQGAGGTAQAPITLRAAPGAKPILSGSVVISGFTAAGSPGVYERAYDETARLNGEPVGVPQQVFIDGIGLLQVGPPLSMPACATPNASIPCMTTFGAGLSDVVATAGTFFFDPNAHVLYLHLADGSSPSLHSVEVSVRRRVLFLGLSSPWFCVEGLTFHHSNATGLPGVQQESGVQLSAHSVLANSIVEQMDFAGIGLGYQQDGSRLSYVIARDNGCIGIGGARSTNVLVEHSQALGNNARQFGNLWVSGGLKFSAGTTGIVRDSRFESNRGPGVWCDFCGAGGLEVLRSRFVGNTREGQIFIEVSDNALVANNLIITDRGESSIRGIYLSESDNARVMFNTIVRLIPAIGIDVGGGGRGTANNAAILGNIVVSLDNAASVADLRIAPRTGANMVTGTTSDHNLFFNSNGAYRFAFGSNSTSLAAWKSASGLDTSSLDVDPVFTDGALHNFSLAVGSPAVDQVSSTLVLDDAVGNQRPQGAADDLGAFERCTP